MLESHAGPTQFPFRASNQASSILYSPADTASYALLGEDVVMLKGGWALVVRFMQEAVPPTLHSLLLIGVLCLRRRQFMGWAKFLFRDYELRSINILKGHF